MPEHAGTREVQSLSETPRQRPLPGIGVAATGEHGELVEDEQDVGDPDLQRRPGPVGARLDGWSSQ
ncbi:hypothetical protein [Streptomyces hygroscopicus]|uniref:hypothetical protein n=1 Tax=Streptomyces hygroscopicus TaxID=1912 RepID=UPI001F44F94C|nr:hypothetical protein [Streptomyces hygroscopicus]